MADRQWGDGYLCCQSQFDFQLTVFGLHLSDAFFPETHRFRDVFLHRREQRGIDTRQDLLAFLFEALGTLKVGFELTHPLLRPECHHADHLGLDGLNGRDRSNHFVQGFLVIRWFLSWICRGTSSRVFILTIAIL